MCAEKTKPRIKCPACHESKFQIQERGLLIKKKILTCEICKTVLEIEGKDHVVISSLGDQYSNAKPFYQGEKIAIRVLC